MKVSIIGAGSWGSALARILGDNGNDVIMFDLDEETILSINLSHTTPKLPNGKLPLNFLGTTNINVALENEVIILCVPTKALRSVLKDINKIIKTPKLFVNASKGIEPDSLKRVSEIVKEEINGNLIKGYVALYGPTHAEEVIEQKLTLACSCSENSEHAKLIQSIFNNCDYFRVYSSNDLIGAEVCGAIKNVYAIASGVLHGLGYGDNAKAGLITRALLEIKKIVVKLGGNESSITSLTCIGDLIATCISHHSRNFQAGVKLAEGKDITEAQNSISMVVEGVRTAEAIHELCLKLNLDCPIIEAIYKVLNKQDAKTIIKELMNRPISQEF